jgi:phospholipid/cholesterol/gamma-HCH transport system permease protein
MTPHHEHAEFIFNTETSQYHCKGSWSILCLEALLRQLEQIPTTTLPTIIITGENISQFDSAGALALLQCKNKLKHVDNNVEFIDFSPKHLQLITLLENKQDAIEYTPEPPIKQSLVYELGKETVNKVSQIDGLIILIGNLADKIFGATSNLRQFHAPSIVSNVYSTGLQALPIIALLSFLIGVVLAYQMGLQLESYGANSFIAYLCGMACFREFAPLITAIIVAGRTSSSFTAQIGSMKINEEVDALETMGLSPIEFLVLPKLLGLLLIFPLLIFWSDVFSIAGAMIMSKFKLDIGYIDFLTRLRNSVGAKQMLLGLYKAPVFAILIALVGCFQGFNVKLNASSIGSQTTKSVVQALFLIIIADAAFSILYSWLHL